MEINAIDNFFLVQQELDKGCYLALRDIIKDWNPKISEHWKYSLPFYYYEGKPFCYLYKNKTSQYPYIGLVKGDGISHSMVFQGNRKKMKVLPVNPDEDIPKELIYEVFAELQKFY